tara:strand:+ start:51 stop:851 length:801 start_codon:yes stop_codon:yes gene_type:complete
MKIKITTIGVFIIILMIFSVWNSKKIKESTIFVGHVYGTSVTTDIPYSPLVNVIKKNNLDSIIFGGDITRSEKDFIKFYNFFLNKKTLYIKGNHDGNLYDKIDYWEKKLFNSHNIINLSNLTFEEVMNFKYKDYNNTFFISHYNWFESLFYPITVSNSKLTEDNIIRFKMIKNFGKYNKFIAGDCGKYTGNPPYVKIEINSNQFVCSGLGLSANNYVKLEDLNPFFFNEDGKIVKHRCEKKNKKKNDYLITICSTKKKHLKSLINR